MDTLTAFYLVGHGPRREPRFIELQHMRVVRYRYLANHPSDPFAAPEIYVDLNQERLPPSSILATSFPQLATLISAIEANKIKLVYLDLFEGEAPGPDFSWIPRLLKDAGAEVVNVFYDELGSLQGLIDVRYGEMPRARTSPMLQTSTAFSRGPAPKLRRKRLEELFSYIRTPAPALIR